MQMLKFTLVLIRSTLTRAGQEPNEQVVESMMSEAPGPLNFTMFLTLFGEKLNGMCMCSCARGMCVCVCVCVCMCSCVLYLWCCGVRVYLSIHPFISVNIYVEHFIFVVWFPILGTDPEDVIRNAFACFDEEATGHINEDRWAGSECDEYSNYQPCPLRCIA